ncbi:CD320 antigen [Amazona ochrocephala]
MLNAVRGQPYSGAAAAGRGAAQRWARGMARLPVLPLLPLLLPLLPPVWPLPPPPARNVTLLRCPPGLFRCAAGAPCVTSEWRCDGHPDCDDGEDELGCGTVPPAEPSPGGAEASTTPVPEGSAPSSSPESLWILVIAALLSILVAVASAAVWGISKAKSRSDIFSPEKASREQLIPDKSQRGSFPQRGSVPRGDEMGRPGLPPADCIGHKLSDLNCYTGIAKDAPLGNRF